MLLTISGAVFLIPFELLDHLNKILKFFGLIFGGIKGKNFIEDFISYLKKKLSGFNRYQLDSLEHQRKVTALLFENLPFTFLVITIKMKILRCPELSDG